MNPTRLCPLCSSKGLTSQIKTYNINFEDVVDLCTNKTCTYPLGTSDFAIRPKKSKRKSATVDSPIGSEFSAISMKNFVPPSICISQQDGSEGSFDLNVAYNSLECTEQYKTKSLPKNTPRDIQNTEMLNNLHLLQSRSAKINTSGQRIVKLEPATAKLEEPVVSQPMSRFSSFSFDNTNNTNTTERTAVDYDAPNGNQINSNIPNELDDLDLTDLEIRSDLIDDILNSDVAIDADIFNELLR